MAREQALATFCAWSETGLHGNSTAQGTASGYQMRAGEENTYGECTSPALWMPLLLLLACVLPRNGLSSGALAQARVEPRLFVLAIGVSRYHDSSLSLRFPAKDAQALAAALQRQAGGLYREVEVRTLLDAQATRESILEALNGFLARAEPNDVAVLFVAGHAIQDRATGSYYFLPHPASGENYVSTGLRMTDLDEMLRLVRRSARSVVVMLDTCHAGALRVAAPHLEALEDPAARLQTGEGFFLLAASKPGEESEERADLGHGAFTYALLEGLAGAADVDRDGGINLTELFGYVARRVAELTQDRQHPYYKVEGTDFRFAAVRAGASVPTLHPAPISDPAAEERAGNTLAVMEFRNLRPDAEHDWVGIALRTAFNTELSKVKALNVYAPELLDRALRQRGGDMVATARQLGIDRWISGSFHIVGDAIRIDARIVFAKTGLQEGSDSVEGPLSEFFSLQKQLVHRLLRRMHVSLPGETAGGNDKSDLNALRLLLESEGEIEPPPATPTRPASRPGRRSSWLTPHNLSWLGARLALAQETPSRERAARELLERYRNALERKDIEAFAALYLEFPAERRTTLQRYWQAAEGLRVDIESVHVQVQGEELVVSFLRRDRFVDRESGKPVTLEVRLTRRLVPVAGGWKIGGKP